MITLVTAALIKHNNTILIAQRKQNDLLGGYWEFPGGKIEDGESPEECLARELYEELGTTADITKFFTETTYEYEHGTIRLLAFAAIVKDPSQMRLTDHERIAWVSPENLLSYRLAPADIAIAKEVLSRYSEL